MSDELVTTSSGASKGAFQGIKKIRGLLTSIKKVPGRFKREGEENARDQVEAKYEDVAILEMDEGETEPELKDNAFTIWMGYALPGKRPSKRGLYIKGFVTSGEELLIAKGGYSRDSQEHLIDTATGKIVSAVEILTGQYVTLEHKLIYLFTNQAGEDVSYEGWVFVKDEGGAVPAMADHIAGLLDGKNESGALRALLMDARAKQHPEYKDALSAGVIGGMIDVELIDGIYHWNRKAAEAQIGNS